MKVVVSAGGKVFFGDTWSGITHVLETDGSAILFGVRELTLPSETISAIDVARGTWKDILTRQVRYSKELAGGASRIARVDTVYQYVGGDPPWEGKEKK